ncbi:hypothetical protein L0Y49_04140 [bacterium]|nr:hypothetical protein [bacterium]MCI0565854.1 hypothetical protein [bacterium]MCI0680351.1 hypothetical protein [bacterium]
MISEFKHGSLIWIDAASPSEKEIAALAEKYAIDPIIAEELRQPSLRGRAEVFAESVYLILHFPSPGRNNEGDINQEVDFIIAKNHLITVHYDAIETIENFGKAFEINHDMDIKNMKDHAGYLFYFLIKKLYTDVDRELEAIDEALEEVEARVFKKGETRGIIEALSDISRDILNMKQGLRSHRDVFVSLETSAKEFFPPKFKHYLNDISGEYYRLWNEIAGQKETLDELRYTNMSLLSTANNEIVKVVSVMAFVTFPGVFIAGLFGMNTSVQPFHDTGADFWFILAIIIAASASLFFYFKRKKWL